MPAGAGTATCDPASTVGSHAAELVSNRRRRNSGCRRQGSRQTGIESFRPVGLSVCPLGS